MSVQTLRANLPMLVSGLSQRVFNGFYKGLDNEYTKYTTKVDPTDGDSFVSNTIAGLRPAVKKPEGTAVAYDQLTELYRNVYLYEVGALGVAISREAIEDSKELDLTETITKHLTRSLNEYRNLAAAGRLNDAFTVNTGDQVPLIAANHPGRLQNYSNALVGNAPLSQASFEAALNQIVGTNDPAGNKAGLRGISLIVPPALATQASVILGSPGRSGTNNNDRNPINVYGTVTPDPLVITRLTSSTAWYVKSNDDRPALLYAEKRALGAPETMVDFETMAIRIQQSLRFVFVPDNPLGIFGSTGLGS